MEKDAVSYKLLQRLAERAWDEADEKQLMRISTAIDDAMLRLMAQDGDDQQAM